MNDDEDDIPLLNDILRPGDTPPAAPATDNTREPTGQAPRATLSDAEIEAIAHRVVERHTQRIEEAIARAIRKALEIKQGKSGTTNEHE